jgi:hypothetical protein
MLACFAWHQICFFNKRKQFTLAMFFKAITLATLTSSSHYVYAIVRALATLGGTT